MIDPGPSASPQLDLAFVRKAGQTILSRRRFRWPFVLTRSFALDTAPAHMRSVILQTGASAIHGEDRLEQRIEVGAGAAAHIITQGAMAVHRADPGIASREITRLRVEEAALLEYMPEPRILFPGSALSAFVDIDCAPGGAAIFSDGFTVFDPGGRKTGFRQFQSMISVRRGSENPLAIERTQLDEFQENHFLRFTAFGTFVLISGPDGQKLHSLAQDLNGIFDKMDGLYAAGSVLPNAAGLWVKYAASDVRALRQAHLLTWVKCRQFLGFEVGRSPFAMHSAPNFVPKQPYG